MSAFAARLAAVRAARETLVTIPPKAPYDGPPLSDISFGGITLTEEQALAPKLALKGESFVLTGAAGTGKTTTQSAVVDFLARSNSFGVHDFKYIGEAPSIAIVAFTKVAVRNMQKALKKNPATHDFARHVMTIHALLEFIPVKEERIDDRGQTYETKIFRPQRHSANPLKLTHLIVEEASMVGAPLWALIYDALPPEVQIIFLGDIEQLTPVAGRPILGYALCRLPVIQLTHPYRTALDNPILANAHRVLRGEMIEASKDGRFNIVAGGGTYQAGQERTGMALSSLFNKLYDLGDYQPDRDMILIPWNKGELGTIRMNQRIATWLGVSRKALVYPIKAGFLTHYLAVGDKLLVDKQACWVTAIEPNKKYLGSAPPPPGAYSRDGTPLLMEMDIDWDGEGEPSSEIDYSDFSLEDVEEDAAKRAASHVVHVTYLAPGEEPDAELGETEEDFKGELSTSGHFSEASFQLGYCYTVHKAQGSEWPKVYVILHKDHAVHLNRELFYTALTRAKEECTILAKPEVIERAIANQSIKGTGLESKIAFLRSGVLPDLEELPLLPPPLDS